MSTVQASMTHRKLVKRRSLLACNAGVASIEFALLGTVLLGMFAGGFDLAFMASARRDADRASMLLARVLVTCDTSCANNVVIQYNARRTNTLVHYPSAVIGMALLQRTSGAIKFCGGNMTYLESDMQTSALNIMKDGDSGAAVYIKTSYKSILPNFLRTWLTSGGDTYRGYTVDVRGNGSACV